MSDEKQRVTVDEMPQYAQTLRISGKPSQNEVAADSDLSNYLTAGKLRSKTARPVSDVLLQ